MENNEKRMNQLDAKTWLKYSFSIWRDIRKSKEESKLEHPAMFPEQLASRLIEIFTKNKGEIVLDPFAGTGSTLIAAMKLGRKGIGFEINQDYIKIINERIKSTQLNLKNFNEELIKPEIYDKDARNMLNYLPKNTEIDLVITSPPYWDILTAERTVDKRDIKSYSDSSKDLGNIHDYNQFLKELMKVFTIVFNLLKKGKHCAVVLMDIRKKAKFYPFHVDLTNKMKKIGFELEEFVIWDRQHEYNYSKPLGYPYVFRFNKVHEFICIFRKP